MNFKFYIGIFILFHIFSIFFWNRLWFFCLLFFFLSLWFLLEKKYKEKIEILYINLAFILIFIFLGFYKNVPTYQNYNFGNYIVSDSSYLNRSNNIFYTDNKYILEDGINQKKFFLNCSLLFESCNLNRKGDEVFVKYVKSCSKTNCSNYIFEIKGGNVNLNYIYFKKKYEAEKNIINHFLIFYLLIDLIFIICFIFKYKMIK